MRRCALTGMVVKRERNRSRRTSRGATHTSHGARSVGCEGQLKRWAAVWRHSDNRGTCNRQPSLRSDFHSNDDFKKTVISICS